MAISTIQKQMLRVAVFAALGAVSVAASAQSAEYRHGYEQGYHDGAEAQAEGHNGPAHGGIIIEEANYGSHEGGFCNARDTIQRVIGWRRHFDVRVGNELCGDPAVNRPKHLEIRYRCGDSQSVRTDAPEHSVIELNCQ
jgi:hypothetical protein